MTVVAMSTDLGSLSENLAAGLADRLGIEIVDHRRFERDMAWCSDADNGDGIRLVEERSPTRRQWKINSRQLSLRISEQILEVAARGNVLLIGSCAAVVLRSVHHVLSVGVRAPREFRERVVMQRLAYNDARIARWDIESSDAIHARFMRRVFDVDWQNPDLYDLILNADRIPVAQSAESVCLLAQAAKFKETPASCAELTKRLRAVQMQEMNASDERFPAIVP